MSLVEHAERELRAAGLFDKHSDYEGMIGDAVMALVRVFASQGHSGMSASMTVTIFDRLARFKNLTPITDNPEDWVDIDIEDAGQKLWQNRRDCSLFSKDAGKTYYCVDDKERAMKESEPFKREERPF